MLFLFVSSFEPPDFHEIVTTNSAIIMMLITLVFEIVLGLAIRSVIIKKEKEDFWTSREVKNEEKELPYIKKNFFLKWFLVGTENRVSVITKVIAIIKNIVFIGFEILCVLHMVVFKNFTYGFINFCSLITFVLQILATVPEYLRHKIKKQNNKKP